MKPIEIVAELKKAQPKLFAQLPDAKAAKLVNAVLRYTAKQIQETAEGKVKIAGLGTFNVKEREQEKNGEKKTVKRVSFNAAKIKAKTKKAD